MGNQIKFVYFDVGGVALLDFSVGNKWQEMALDLGVPDENFPLFRSVFSRNEVGLCGGQNHYDEMVAKLRETLNIEFPPDYDMLTDFVSRFERNDSIHPLVDAAKDRYKVGLLTNMYPHMLDRIKQSSLLSELEWDVIIDSSIVGVCKPMPEIFQISEKRAGVEPEEILFIDNTAGHLEAAKERGWQTFLYDPSDLAASNQRLKKALKIS